MSAITLPDNRANRPASLARFAILATLIIAFGLRAYHLDTQSLWSDEGISLQRALQPLPALLHTMPVEHTPGYFVLLHGWLTLTGEVDYALRFFSLLPGVLAVAILYRLGIDLAWQTATSLAPLVALAGALLLATGEFQVWYAQETRMYTWLLATGLLSNWTLWRLLAQPGRRGGWWTAVYALATAALVYLHFYGALVPVAQAMFVAGWAILRRDRRGFTRWLLANLAALLLFAPWLPRALAIFGFQGWREGGNAAEIPWRYLAAYTAGDAMPAPWQGWLPWIYLLLAGGGAWYWWRTRRSAALFLLVGIVLPFAAVLALAARSPDFHERYSIYLAAPLLLLVAGGIGLLAEGVGRMQPPAMSAARRTLIAALSGVAVLLLLAASNGLALQQLYTNASLHKPDYRSAAARISASLQPGDVVLVDGPDPAKVFLHYFKAVTPVFSVADLERAGLDQVDAAMGEMIGDARRVWELLYFHYPGDVQVWLATRAWATEATDHNGIRVTLYGLDGQLPADRPVQVDFGEALTLENAAVDSATPQPGGLLMVTTRWSVHSPAPEYKFSLRLHNSAGGLVQSADYVPQNWLAPTNVWLVGQPAADQRGLLLAPDLPPGPYRLTLRLYDPVTGAPVETTAGQDVPLADLQIG